MGLSSGAIVKVVVEDRVAVVTIDHPPVNALNRQTLTELGQMADAVTADPAVKVIVLTGGGSFAFVAGADLKEISHIGSPPRSPSAGRLGTGGVPQAPAVG